MCRLRGHEVCGVYYQARVRYRVHDRYGKNGKLGLVCKYNKLGLVRTREKLMCRWPLGCTTIEVVAVASQDTFTMMQHEQEQDSLSNPRPPIRVDERPLQKRYNCFTADDARAVFVGGNEVDEQTCNSRITITAQPKTNQYTPHPTSLLPEETRTCHLTPTRTSQLSYVNPRPASMNEVEASLNE